MCPDISEGVFRVRFSGDMSGEVFGRCFGRGVRGHQCEWSCLRSLLRDLRDLLLRFGLRIGFVVRVGRVVELLPLAYVLPHELTPFGSRRGPADGADLPFAGEVEAYIRSALRKKNPDRPLETNVEFFTAILLDALAIPRQAFTPNFAVARAAGWTAHARERQRTGRLIRPSSSYVGAMPAD